MIPEYTPRHIIGCLVALFASGVLLGLLLGILLGLFR
jgi:hypothetical protein